MTNHNLRELFPNIISELPLTQLHSDLSCPISGHQREEPPSLEILKIHPDTVQGNLVQVAMIEHGGLTRYLQRFLPTPTALRFYDL